MIVSKDRRTLTAERLGVPTNHEERRAAPNRQLAGSGSLDATNVRFRSQFDALASSAFIFASTVKPFAGRDCIIAPERG